MRWYGLSLAAGYEAVTNFKPILLVFAGVLIFSSYKLLAEEEEEEEDMSENAIVKFCSGLLPVSEAYDGDRFFTLVDGVKTAGGQPTPTTHPHAPHSPHSPCRVKTAFT